MTGLPDSLPVVPAGPQGADALSLLSWGDAMTWEEYEIMVRRTAEPFEGQFEQRFFNYVHPTRLQGHWPSHQVKPTEVRMAYTDWGDPDGPLVICVGGIANTARRWDYMALGLCDDFHVVCLDWPGRGMSGWMPTQGDYSIATNVEVLRQLITHLDYERASIIGSSLGGSSAIAFCAEHPGVIDRLILNDIGPYIPAERRRRRAQAVARHYIFRRPADLFRRLGASAKNEGPVTEDELLHNTYYQTQWSDGHGGRIYRHDPRALQAYAEEAQDSLTQWEEWAGIDMPVLVIHGMLSDALLPDTVDEMIVKPGVTAMHVPDTGHTPALSDANQIHFLRSWILGEGPESHFTSLNPPATPRHLFGAAPVPAKPAPVSGR
ncbi:alpha/beta fold hydrolase [Azospirillum canadense]|uniref:alpha/beta fold hydrolase n=1 Tax=Azospirillum canadense TaxID=403962 RepID=UPI002226EBCF|nr:alpha/beta hydrolase [Azospirillum canadense]MCW2238725.1 pimeloyl-ACP methyl ester carboxylesterase [Azospirillum canadense]